MYRLSQVSHLLTTRISKFPRKLKASAIKIVLEYYERPSKNEVATVLPARKVGLKEHRYRSFPT
jgi:hypothetical protein